MLDLRPDDDQQMLIETGQQFARRDILPFIEWLNTTDASTDIAEVSLRTRRLFGAGKALGFTHLLLPERYGGVGGRCIDAVLLLEELGAADVAVAADLFALNATVPLIVLKAGTESQRAQLLGEFIEQDLILSGALSEPTVAGSELFCPQPDASLGIRTHARRDDDGYVLSGQKSAFITNAALADRFFVMARTDPGRPLHETLSVFHVAAGTPGLQVGRRTELIGWRASHHAEVVLDGVRLESSALIGQEGQGAAIMSALPQMPICLAACFLGLARSALHTALEYARERRSWGKAIIEHQAVGLKLADMRAELDAARLMVWDAALAVDSDPFAAATLKAPAAKTMAVDVAIRNSQRAVEILGAYGVTREYPAGRRMNDAWVGYACDFTRDMLRLGMVPFL